jgi:hypothetical protein
LDRRNDLGRGFVSMGRVGGCRVEKASGFRRGVFGLVDGNGEINFCTRDVEMMAERPVGGECREREGR